MDDAEAPDLQEIDGGVDLIVPDESAEWIALHRTDITEDLCAEYARSVYRDYLGMEPFFPDGIGSVLDIGGGQGGLLAMIAKRTGARPYLMDGSGLALRRTNMNIAMDPYNDMGSARRLLEANGVEPVLLDLSPDATVPVDLIISTLSWGFHYPSSTYEPLARRSLDTGGRVILDIRKNGLGEGFTEIGCIKRVSGKADRICYERI